MSEVTLNVLDSHRSIHTKIHGSFSDAVVAALGADSETIEELETAIGRYWQRPEGCGFFDGWDQGVSDEPWDAGIVYVDLPGRLIAVDSTWSRACPNDAVHWHDARGKTDISLPYRLSDDWMFCDVVDGWEQHAQKRRAQRLAHPPVDALAVLYDRLAEWIVSKVARRRGDLPRMDEQGRYELIRDIHADWLTTPRDDLRGRSPRDVILDQHDHLGMNLQNQGHRWSFVRQLPPGVHRDSAAYRFSGFGTDEIVLYYDLVRHLLAECVDRFSHRGDIDQPAEADHLRQLRQEWMHSPHDDLHGRSPAYAIDRERARLPMTVSGEDVAINHDCPLCEMADDDKFGPTFWHLDGCNMDDEFAFSFHRTRDQWEEKQRKYERWSREFDEKRKRDQTFIDGQLPLGGYMPSHCSVWRTSFSNPDASEGMPAAQALPIMLFATAPHLGELGEDISTTDEGKARAKSMRCHFADLRHAVDDENPWMTKSAAARFAEDLKSITKTRPDLADKCADLEGQIDRLLQRCRELQDF